ncbi:hypothetical protein PN441_01400 [Spirulina major CS-329]|nr:MULTISPECIES: hypothetical protein [Spirulina]MDB9494845.1 hypothetical protein [Spirulina subsalsa CS-330]MDB9501710.1 hypothetical protein [Spirulina major CS-329]
MTYEVNKPILNNSFDEPQHYWFIRDGYDRNYGQAAALRSCIPPREGKTEWELGRVLAKSSEFAPGFEITLVNQLRSPPMTNPPQSRSPNDAGMSAAPRL